VTQRLGFLAHELRNSLQTATMAFTALESGKLSILAKEVEGKVQKGLGDAKETLKDSGRKA